MQKVVSPNYVRKVRIQNSEVHVKLRFIVQYAQNSAFFDVNPNGQVDIEGTIDHGSYQAVDPIKKITVTYPEEGSEILSVREFNDVQGVQNFHYEV